MQAPPIVVQRFRVEHGPGFTVSVVDLPDRRAAGHRVVRFVYQRHLEAVLYGRTEGSSGPIWKLMSQTGMGITTLAVNKQSVVAGIITDAEFVALMAEFRAVLPGDMIDPSSLGRIRNCTLLPMAAAATIARSFGRSPASLAWLRAFNQPIPEAWELREEQEANAAVGEVDLLLDDKLDELGFEAEDISFADELKTMAAFNTDRDDEERLKTYILQRISPAFKKELETFLLYRTETFAARRQGGAVQSISAEADRTALLRLFGYMEHLNRIPAGAEFSISFLCRPDVGDLVQDYATWLQNTQGCKFSTIANYLNGLVSLTTYAYANFEPPAEVLNAEPNPLTQVINLRSQAEKASKTQQLYEKRVGGWIEWEEVQQCRVATLAKLNDALQSGTSANKRMLMRDACAISLMSLIPPDRVGCIRKLRLQHTLKRKEAGGWKMDLSNQRDGHKTSRFYGPFAASLPDALTPILDMYANTLEMEFGGEMAYLFHPPHGSNDRPMESAAWSSWVKRLFKRHHGTEVCPKTLRSVFVTWLRDSTADQSILKSAAHAMKHSEQRQASNDYDQESDDRLVKAAFEFNLQYAAGFTFDLAGARVGGLSASGEGSSSNAPPPPPNAPPPPNPPPPPPTPQRPPVESRMLPPVPTAEFATQLEDVGFARGSARGNGDCYPLSAMAGFEISASAARTPTPQTTAVVRQPRRDAANLLTNDTPIDGIQANVVREAEMIPSAAVEAAAALAPWRSTGFWHAGDGANKSAFFMMGVAVQLGRPVIVIEKNLRSFLDPARIYGARNADGSLVHSAAKPNAPETIPSFETVSLAEMMRLLRASPTRFSLVEYNGSNHFTPWVLKPALRKAAAKTVEAADASDAASTLQNAVAASFVAPKPFRASGSETDGDDEGDGAGDDGIWLPLPGAPFVAHIDRGGPRTTAATRKYDVTIPIDPASTLLYPGGKIKFPIVPGAPAEGIICDLPNNLSAESKSVTFTLRLDRAGATSDSVTINSALYLQPPGALAADLLAAKQEEEDKADAEQASIRSTHMEENKELMPVALSATPWSPSPLAGAARQTFCFATLAAPLPGEPGTVVVEPPSTGCVPEAQASQMASVAQAQALSLGDRFVMLDDARQPHAIARVIAVNDEATRFMHGANGEKYHVEILSFAASAEMLEAAIGLKVRDLEDCFVARVLPVAKKPVRSSSRPHKRPRLSHPPSHIEEATSTSMEPLPTIVDDSDLSDLAVGQAVVAFGRAPDGKWTRYRGKITGFRNVHPKVVVKYMSTMDGNPLRLLLPSPNSAYLSRSDIELGE